MYAAGAVSKQLDILKMAEACMGHYVILAVELVCPSAKDALSVQNAVDCRAGHLWSGPLMTAMWEEWRHLSFSMLMLMQMLLA